MNKNNRKYIFLLVGILTGAMVGIILLKVSITQDTNSVDLKSTITPTFSELKAEKRSIAAITSDAVLATRDKPLSATIPYDDGIATMKYPLGWSHNETLKENKVIGVRFSKGPYFLDIQYQDLLTSNVDYGMLGDGLPCGQSLVTNPSSKPNYFIGKDDNYVATNLYLNPEKASPTECNFISKLSGERWGGAIVLIDKYDLFKLPRKQEQALLSATYGYKYKDWRSISWINRFGNDSNVSDILPEKNSDELLKNLIEMDSILYSLKFSKPPLMP